MKSVETWVGLCVAATLAAAAVVAVPAAAVAQVPSTVAPQGPLRPSVDADPLADPQLRRLVPAAPDSGDASPSDPNAPPSAAVTADGQPTDAAAEPAMPVDGVLVDPDPIAVVDGPESAAVDSRDQDDVRAFAPVEVPAGYDPAAFAIELDARLDRRPAQLFLNEPFAPVGIRIGSFIVYPEMEVDGAAFSNLFHTGSGAMADVAFEDRAAIRAVSDWKVHALELTAKGFLSFHDRFAGEDDRAFSLDARGRIDVTRRTNVEVELSHDQSQLSRGAVNSVATAGSRPEVTADLATVAINQRFNRLTVQLRGSLLDREYGASTDGLGNTTANPDLNLTQRDAAVRTSWEFKPELSLFVEAGRDDRSYGAASRADGISRNSSGDRLRAGVSFGNTGAVLRGEASLGLAEQDFADRRLPALKGVIVDSNLAWKLDGLTTLLVTATSDVGDSSVVGSGGSITRRAGVEVRHALRKYLVASLGTRYTRADYGGVAFVEQDLETRAGLEYYLSRELMLFARYVHVDFNSTLAADNYSADEIRVGFKVQR